jgi:hypothetical protein
MCTGIEGAGLPSIYFDALFSVPSSAFDRTSRNSASSVDGRGDT